MCTIIIINILLSFSSIFKSVIAGVSAETCSIGSIVIFFNGVLSTGSNNERYLNKVGSKKQKK